MTLLHKVLVVAWIFLLPGLIMGETGWMGGTFLHTTCVVVGGFLAVWALLLAVTAFGEKGADE